MLNVWTLGATYIIKEKDVNIPNCESEWERKKAKLHSLFSKKHFTKNSIRSEFLTTCCLKKNMLYLENQLIQNIPFLQNKLHVPVFVLGCGCGTVKGPTAVPLEDKPLPQSFIFGWTKKRKMEIIRKLVVQMPLTVTNSVGQGKLAATLLASTLILGPKNSMTA